MHTSVKVAFHDTKWLGQRKGEEKAASYIKGAIGKPIANSAESLGKFLYKEINPGWINCTKDRHNNFLEIHRQEYVSKQNKLKSKINNLPKELTYSQDKNKKNYK